MLYCYIMLLSIGLKALRNPVSIRRFRLFFSGVYPKDPAAREPVSITDPNARIISAPPISNDKAMPDAHPALVPASRIAVLREVAAKTASIDTVSPVPRPMTSVESTPAANSFCERAKTKTMSAPEHGRMPIAKIRAMARDSGSGSFNVAGSAAWTQPQPGPWSW